MSSANDIFILMSLASKEEWFINCENNNKRKTEMKKKKRKRNALSIIRRFIGFLLIIMIFATLPFHYLYKKPFRVYEIFPKSNLTFDKTFINNDDIKNLIDRYNHASIFEKTVINNEPLMRKLIEKGFIDNGEVLSTKKENIIIENVNSFIKEFKQNVQEATMKYDNKYLTISGNVTNIYKNDMKLNNKINCIFESKLNYKKGDYITIEGKFTGYDEMFEEIRITKCLIIND